MHREYQPQHRAPTSSHTDRSTDAESGVGSAGRHRRPTPPGRSGRFGSLLTSAPARLTLVAGLTCCLGVAAGPEPRPEPAAGAGRTVTERTAAAEHQAASRSRARIAQVDPGPAPTATPSTAPVAPSPSTASPTPTKPARPEPVAGLTRAQMDNAQVIVEVGAEMGIPRRGQIIAVATAMQESNLYNLASGAVPESLNYPNQGTGWDHDSVGLFQQRSSSGWGAIADLMRPAYAARKFYEALRQIPGWEQLSLSVAAQSVQVSAFPDAYAQHEQRATVIVDALL